MERTNLGQYPTPVELFRDLSAPGFELWVKDDGVTNSGYGGNKVRKLEHVLADAHSRGATRLVTVGAAGSHHVLATSYFGARAGFSVEAVLVKQPRTDHAIEVLRASLALGMRPFPAPSWAHVPLLIASRVAAGAEFIPLGGSNLAGTMGYFEAAAELAAQVRSGELPEPDVCVVALGSGGTAAGLAAGLEATGMKTRVVAVCVAEPPAVVRLWAGRLATRCANAHGVDARRTRERLLFDSRFLGAGYGHRTPAGDDATRDAARVAHLALDPTYTAKAFAAALWHVRARRTPRVLYWHTLSSAPIAPLIMRGEKVTGREPIFDTLLVPRRS
jgi:1-aminocyclopropane-1-carboxylate deaminase/D-cysteine desulfhydrase-like pyridoxal-dependent ACC family enzyme